MLASSEKCIHLLDGSLLDSAAFNLFHSKFTWGSNSHIYWPLAHTQCWKERIVSYSFTTELSHSVHFSRFLEEPDCLHQSRGLVCHIPSAPLKAPSYPKLTIASMEPQLCLELLTPGKEPSTDVWGCGVFVRNFCHCTMLKVHKNIFKII